jgi:tetratricopeptide (TPR) repeat protein
VTALRTLALGLGLALAAAPAPARAEAPFRREEPNVREGNEAVRRGDGEAALRHYDAAEKAAGARPEIAFDRGHALQRMGRTPAAVEAWRGAAEGAPPALASRALQNAGTALAAAGDRAGAVEAFVEALARDPGNEDARYGLEVLLRGTPPPPPPPPPGGGEEEGKPAGGDSKEGEGGEEREPRDARPRDGGARPDEQPGPPARAPERGPDPREGERRGPDGPAGDGAEDAGRPRAGPLDRQDAERLLDALRARERRMPLGPGGREPEKRRDDEKDW